MKDAPVLQAYHMHWKPVAVVQKGLYILHGLSKFELHQQLTRFGADTAICWAR